VTYRRSEELGRSRSGRGIATLTGGGDPHESSVAVQHDDVGGITFGQAIAVGKHG
jgi:hypothetical protein